MNSFACFPEIRKKCMSDSLTKEIEISDIEDDVLHKLIIYNSSHLWDEVVVQLMKATGFDNIRCEQIAIFAHTKGKALVCSGKLTKLNRINAVLREIKLVTEIE